MYFKLLVLSALFFAGVFGQAHMSCGSKTPVYGNPNTFPILDGASAMTLLRSVPNGTVYLVTVPNSGGNTTQTFYLSQVWGNPYQQGYAQGLLLANEISQFMNEAWNYIDSQVEEVLYPYIPEWLANKIGTDGLDVALDYTYDITVKHTDPDFYDELHGIADGSGVDYLLARRLHMIPGVTKGACSMFGAWGRAVELGAPGHLLQLRALDWDMDGPFKDYSAITVYHPDSNNRTQGHKWINIGMTGFIGALSGISETRLAISEIGVSYPDSSWPHTPESAIPIPGIPFIVMLRDILKYDLTLDDSISRMANAPRDCDLILGVGDGKLGYFRGFQYSPWIFNVFDPLNMRPDNSTWHPKMPDVVYWGMDWECPTFNLVLSQQLKKYYGNITAEVAVQNISAVEQSGDNHLVFYDLTSMEIYVAFAAPHNVGGPAEAYSRQFVKFDVKQLFAAQPPKVKLIN